MRKIVMLNRVSIDGFFAGPNGEIDWFRMDPEVEKAAHEMMNPDTILFGRVTYQLFESYWPHVEKIPDASNEARVTAEELNQMTKVVFSKSLEEVSWTNSKLASVEIVQVVKDLKQGEGADIVIFGSGTIVQQLANEDLIDEYIVVVTPIILEKGKPLFKDVKVKNLKLLETRHFNSGNVLLHYSINK